MKKIIFTLITLALALNPLKAQTYPLELFKKDGHPRTNAYYKDVAGTLNKFIGIWEFSDATTYLKVRFYKVENTTSFEPSSQLSPYTFDELRSYMEYKVKINNQWVTKYNTFLPLGQYPPPPASYLAKAIRGKALENSNTLRLSYYEPTTSCLRTRQAVLRLNYTVNTSGQIQLIWSRRNSTGGYYIPGDLCDDGTPVDDSPFIIPMDLVLTKI